MSRKSASSQTAHEGWENQREGNKRQVPHHHVRRRGNVLGSEGAHIHAFHDGHPRIFPQSPREKSVTNVDRENFFRTAAQQNVREAAGGGSSIDDSSILDDGRPIAKHVENTGKLVGTTGCIVVQVGIVDRPIAWAGSI